MILASSAIKTQSADLRVFFRGQQSERQYPNYSRLVSKTETCGCDLSI